MTNSDKSMSGGSAVSDPPHASMVSRSLGVKLIVILVLIVLMAIPVMFISFIAFDRSDRADTVTREVSETYGGEQTLLGPILVVPYRETLSNGVVREGDYIVSASTGSAMFSDVSVEEKSRSLYKVPVYTADVRLSANLPALSGLADRPGLRFDKTEARIVIALGNVTGLQSDVMLEAGARSLAFEPHSSVPRFGIARAGYRNDIMVEPARARPTAPDIVQDRLSMSGLSLLSVPATDLLATTDQMVTATLSFTGAKRLSVAPYAKSTTMRIVSDWPHPGFGGQFPPSAREMGSGGFTADWSVPYLRRGIADQGRASDMGPLIYGDTGYMTVNFVSPLDPYQTVNRALKYAVLFIGLVFLAYFLMETLLGIRVHPAQYLLIGIAQAVFYLLLLAFAEQIGFTAAFLLSAAATVALTAGYAGAVFGRDMIWKSALVFGGVYALLFVLMRVQDFALMVGALISFLAVAATLYLTRNLNWYGDRDG